MESPSVWVDEANDFTSSMVVNEIGFDGHLIMQQGHEALDI